MEPKGKEGGMEKQKGIIWRAGGERINNRVGKESQEGRGRATVEGVEGSLSRSCSSVRRTSILVSG